MTAPVKILSIDGGGIKGIIPATVLAYIEERTGRHIASLFDLIAGTSTGGIIALGLTKPGADGSPAYTARDGVELYVREGPNIFSRPWWRKLPFFQLFEERYASGPIEGVLERYFGATHLKDALTEVIVTAYEIERRSPFFFKSRHAKDPSRHGYDFLMKDAARATAAAPTYFEPAKVAAVDDPSSFVLIDGGVHAVNPAMCAYVEARATRPDAGEILLVSLGTGESTSKLPYEKVKGWGEAQWARPILDVVFDGMSDTVDFQLRELLPPIEGLLRYYRFQIELDTASDDMDDVRPQNLRALQQLGDQVVAENQKALDQLCDELARPAAS